MTDIVEIEDPALPLARALLPVIRTFAPDHSWPDHLALECARKAIESQSQSVEIARLREALRVFADWRGDIRRMPDKFFRDARSALAPAKGE